VLTIALCLVGEMSNGAETTFISPKSDMIGRCLIFHGYRIDRERSVLVWSPNYHTLGLLKAVLMLVVVVFIVVKIVIVALVLRAERLESAKNIGILLKFLMSVKPFSEQLVISLLMLLLRWV
jgi:hypothetical protein